RSVPEAILEPRVDVMDGLIEVYIGISIRHNPVLSFWFHNIPFRNCLRRSCTGNSGVGGIDGRYGEVLVVCADDGQQRSVLRRCIGDWVKIVQECGKCWIGTEV